MVVLEALLPAPLLPCSSSRWFRIEKTMIGWDILMGVKSLATYFPPPAPAERKHTSTHHVVKEGYVKLSILSSW